MTDHFKGSVRRDGENAVITLPMTAVHGLRVALTPVRQGETTSVETDTIRHSLDKALARLESGA